MKFIKERETNILGLVVSGSKEEEVDATIPQEKEKFKKIREEEPTNLNEPESLSPYSKSILLTP